MQLPNRLRTPAAAFIHDLMVIPIAWLGAYWLRFNFGPIPDYVFVRALSVLPVLILVQGIVFWHLGLYRGVWRFASMPDLIRIFKAVLIGTSITAVCMFLLTRMEGIPRSLFPLHALLLVISLGGPRFVYRWSREHYLYAGPIQTALIVGAGRAGEMLVRDLLRDKAYGYHPAAFVDDDPAKQGRDVHGVRVLGDCIALPRLVAALRIDVILIALPSASARQMRRVVGLCEAAKVPFRTLPRMRDLISGVSTVTKLREVSIDDLLGREPVTLDWHVIRRAVAGKTILVTGGGGSIGAELCRQIVRLQPKRLVVFDQSEYNLYAIEQELRESVPTLCLDAFLGDVCDGVAMNTAVARHRPQIVFHAAAYKHVPMLEPRVREAVRNNILGTQNVASAAVKHHVEAFVLISSDKAVNPSSIMGTTKRAAEIVCQGIGRQHPQTRFLTVRFGNVLDSAGSVVPLFRRQIAAGGPVTVTHPEVRRYFMTIPEACQLILEAAAIGQGGEVFVLDMGEPIAIRYLAEQMIVLAGKQLGHDIDLTYIGLRPGEKLAEELFHEQEGLSATGHDKILLARHRREPSWPRLTAWIAGLETACEQYDEVALRALLGQFIPEFAAPVEHESNIIPLGIMKK
nr:polysaccharide biosynthesis protein [Gammaproteobacteria bacterium]